jgi:hypothetical protein
MDSKHILHTTLATALGVGAYFLIVALIPALNPTTIASKFTTASTPTS